MLRFSIRGCHQADIRRCTFYFTTFSACSSYLRISSSTLPLLLLRFRLNIGKYVSRCCSSCHSTTDQPATSLQSELTSDCPPHGFRKSKQSHPFCTHHSPSPSNSIAVKKMAIYGQRVSQPAIPLIRSIQPRPYQNQQQGYLPNGNSTTGPTPGAQPLLPHNGRIIQQGATRVLCIADVRGRSCNISLHAMADP